MKPDSLKSSGTLGKAYAESISDILRAAGRLKTVKRTGWIKKAGIRNAESVADHSYRMAVLGILLGEQLKLDSSKVVRMCLIHDPAESVTGDLMPEEKISEQEHRVREGAILRSFLSELPAKTGNLLLGDLKELMKSKTEEARLTWEIDKLEMGLQRRDYLKAGFDKRPLSQFDNKKRLSKAMRIILDSYMP